MGILPDTMNRSTIEEVVDPAGITLRWWPPAAGLLHYGMAAPYVVFFCILVCACYGGGASIFSEPASALTCGMIVVLCVFTYVGASLAFGIWALFAPDRPASIRLQAESLRFDPGRSKVSMRKRFFTRPSEKREPTPQSIDALRSEIRGFVLERVGEHQRLYLVRGDDRLEIGAELAEPEREWLFAFLQKWHTRTTHTS